MNNIMNDKLRIISGKPEDVEERSNRFLSNDITIKNINEKVIYTTSGICVTLFIYYTNPMHNDINYAKPSINKSNEL